ncbi:MAG: polyprenyl synthetase family protein [bacterium]|nr:polyprenyl synthetase family protein [bacterium]
MGSGELQPNTMSSSIQQEMERDRKRVEKNLAVLLNGQKGIPARLKSAMNHSLLSGGKRLRPILVLWTFGALSNSKNVVSAESALNAACAVEMLHTYSLIHDDLPAMDDDVLRRGRPTCHIEFDEATAILAGDGLQALAFTLLAQNGGPAAGPLVQCLGHAVGPAGMVGGQQDDLDSEGQDVDARLVRKIHLNKTAALLAASLQAGAILANASDETVQGLYEAGLQLGLAFQGADDVLDVTGTTEQLGKSAGKDEAADKATWVRIEGLEEARVRTARYGNNGLQGLQNHLPKVPASEHLMALASLMWNRDH